MGRRKIEPKINIDATELRNNFRSALHKREQIEIEADLHCCSPRAIAEVLDQIGALEGTGIKPRQFSDRYDPVPPAQSGRRTYRFDTAKALELYRKGVSVNHIGTVVGVSHTSICNWIKNEGLSRPPVKPGRPPKKKTYFKLEGGEDVKAERPVEDALLEKETEQERHEHILESVDEGKRELPAAAPTRCQPGRAVSVWDGYIVPEPSRISMEPRENAPMSVKQFRVAMCKLLSDALDDAALSINGETVRDIFGVEIVVRAGRVMVDLRTTQEAS